MKKLSFDIVDIDWEGPFPITYDRAGDCYLLDQIPSELLLSSGIYQIYGRHPVYGKDSLLYIGETKVGESGRPFKSRLVEHLREGSRFFGHTNLSVHLGVLDLPNDIVQKVESILIFNHAPALNRRHIDGPIAGAETLLVRNWSFVGALESACLGLWEE